MTCSGISRCLPLRSRLEADSVNSTPKFGEGASTVRFVRENTAAEMDIGAPVMATDADAGTTLIYTLGGRDAASFGIDWGSDT